jgi:hypothetical protein
MYYVLCTNLARRRHPKWVVDAAGYERKVMTPFYRTVMAAIRSKDPEHLLIYEPCVNSFEPGMCAVCCLLCAVECVMCCVCCVLCAVLWGL